MFNSIFLVPVLFTRCFNNHGSPLLSFIMLDFCEVNSVLRVFFRILLSESIFFLVGFSVSGKAFFWVVQKCPTPLIPVCRCVKSTPMGDPRSIKYRQPLILRCALRIKMSVIWGLYSGNILLITLKLDLSREFILMQNSPPLTTEKSYLTFKHLTRVI